MPRQQWRPRCQEVFVEVFVEPFFGRVSERRFCRSARGEEGGRWSAASEGSARAGGRRPGR
eukprot:7881419-Pyramimonas_sp.AAC.1